MSYWDEQYEEEDETSPLYYRVAITSNDQVTVRTMQWFDEPKDRRWFVTGEDGEELRFNEEEEAAEWINENIKREKIDPEYFKPMFHKEDYFL